MDTSPHSTDLNHRRLADLLFLFRDYESAYSAYHALKKDFSYAPIYQASSLEMCAIAHVLAFPSKPVQHSYLRHALSIYASITDDSIRFELTLRCCALASLLLEQSRHYVLLVSFYITPFTMNYPLESAVLLDKCCFSNVEHGILKLIMMEPITAICYESAGLLSNAIACLRSFLTKFQNTSWVDLQVAIKTLLAQYLLRKDNKCASEVYELINSCSLCGLKFASNYVAASYLKVCDNLFELDYYIPQLFPLVIYDSIHVVNILPKSPLSEEIFSTSHCSINHLIDEFKLMHRIAFVDGTLSHEQCIHPIKLNDSFALILKLKAVINLDYFIEIIGFKSRIDQLLEDIKLNDSSVLAIFEDEFSEITIRCTCIKAGIFAVRFIFCKLMFDDVNNEYQDLYLNIPIFQGSEEYLLFECTDIIPSVTICDDTTRQQFGIKIEGQLSCIHIVAANFSSHSYLIYPRDHCCIFKDGKQLIERTALAMDASKYNIMSFTNNVDIQLSFISRRNIQLPLLFTCKSNNKDRHRYKFVGIYLKHDIKSIAIMKTDRIENNFITVQISNLQNPNNEFNYVMQPILFRLMRTNEFFSGLSMVSTHAAVKIQKGQTLNLLFQAIEADDKNKNLNERSTNNCDFFHDGDNNTVWMFNKFSLHEVVTKSLQTFSSKSLNNDSSILLLYRLIIFQGAELLCILVSNLNNDNYQNFANKSILNDITHKSLPCTISVDVPVLITHDFSKQSLCLIPIQLEVTNNSENLVRFCYQLKKSIEGRTNILHTVVFGLQLSIQMTPYLKGSDIRFNIVSTTIRRGFSDAHKSDN
ncbi:hypothetical protein GJ496_002761 [Pomphorhynchus laevis]|nr:hypothetical protein GJ496_002761 [Pomphorhynchus laevis]